MTDVKVKEVHILTVDGVLNEEQYIRLKQQCSEQFGEGKFLLLEGGVKYAGTTTILAEADRTDYSAMREALEEIMKAEDTWYPGKPLSCWCHAPWQPAKHKETQLIKGKNHGT